jgi:hypothetical protein
MLARLLPPPSPADTIDQVAHLYAHNTNGLRLGVVVMQVAGAVLGPWVAATTTQLKRIEGDDSPLTYTNLGLGMLTLIVFVVPPMAWQAAAFRLDRDSSAIQALHDLGWLAGNCGRLLSSMMTSVRWSSTLSSRSSTLDPLGVEDLNGAVHQTDKGSQYRSAIRSVLLAAG